MNSDAILLRDIQDELRREPVLQNYRLDVTVLNGAVTLAGPVNSLAAKIRAEKAVKRVRGVKAVVQHMEVKCPPRPLSDEEITRAAGNALRWHGEVPEQALRVRVQHGWVTLEGEVDRPYQKHAAEKAVQYLPCVQGITNLLAVRTRAMEARY